jgi:hypothetical protein
MFSSTPDVCFDALGGGFSLNVLFYYLRIFHSRSMCIFLVFAHDDARYGLTTFHTDRKHQGLGLQTAMANQHFEV